MTDTCTNVMWSDLAARKARVQYLVTHDKDLTVQDVTTEQIRRWFAPILPAVFLRDVMS